MVDVAAYIREAKSKAQSGPEREVIKAAVSLSKTPRYAEAVAARPEYRMFTTRLEQRKVESWKRLILHELRDALCNKKTKYSKSMSDLKKNGNLLIAAVAGYVAALVGISVAVVAALVAAVLRLVIQMGTASFCARMKQEHV